jgi:hypothetical protein
MRLLNTESLELQFFVPGKVPDYVILSHRWSTQSAEECTFEDVTKTSLSDPNSPARKKQGFSKVQGACDLAARDGYCWIWIDSCCIDKSSSAELQEAINSMWNYYAESNICYVYMADIPDAEAGWDHRFRMSEWFTRGWTLQELIAPVSVEFYAGNFRNWVLIGTKFERHEEIASITGIDPNVLLRTQAVDIFSAAERLSWAAHRKVTRDEDEAYCLLGLFDVNMPLLYGEGQQKAFIRLQEAIYNSTADHSLFLFRHSLHHKDQPLLADSPTRFCEKKSCIECSSGGARVQCLPSDILYTNIPASERWSTQAHEQIMTTVTSFRNEMSTTLPLLEYQEVSGKLTYLNNNNSPTGVTHVAVLNHTLGNNMKGALCLLLRRVWPNREVFRRTQLFPAFLSHYEEFTSKLRMTKILLCPGPINPNQNSRIETIFCVRGDSFFAEEWSMKGGIYHSILPAQERQNDFKIQSNNSSNSKRQAQVSCHISNLEDSNLRLLLHLVRIDEIWSIKEVSELERSKRPRRQHADNRFISDILTDRCSLPLSGGKILSVSLRRLPALSRGRSDDFISQIRYQIAIKY